MPSNAPKKTLISERKSWRNSSLDLYGCEVYRNVKWEVLAAAALLLGGDHAIDSLSLLQLLLHLNHQLDTINHHLHLGHLGGAQTVSVGDVEHTTHGGCVHTTCGRRRKRNEASTQSGQDLLELSVCAELGQLDVHSTAQAGSQVGGAGQDVAQMLVPHEAMVVLLEDPLNLTSTNAEASEDLLHVAALLHGDDTQMILLVHPDQEDASAVGPVTGHSGAGQQGGHGLVKQEVIVDQQVLLGVGHAAQGVLSLKLTIQAGQS
ncbi:hypothetical protein F7725_020408 [Dissostichus mawsoni]|uniref:Uncharacterized protein n=1 Tax=Dissostichus mawsoni TaxID=36200 RepID=A0A7J5YD84_DISMA|nr:hypothetical protein F7725_020408 [Dissostichus mawsoni]